MATLTVFRFASAEGADSALDSLLRRQHKPALAILDVATVSWPKGRNRPCTRHAPAAAGTEALDGAFWGMLFGLIFFVPVLVDPLGAATAALHSLLVDVGIDDNFVYHIRSKITEGRSALFILSRNLISDGVFENAGQLKPELIATNLPRNEEIKLRNLFAKT
jgi:uncharacterized membrane protein